MIFVYSPRNADSCVPGFFLRRGARGNQPFHGMRPARRAEKKAFSARWKGSGARGNQPFHGMRPARRAEKKAFSARWKGRDAKGNQEREETG